MRPAQPYIYAGTSNYIAGASPWSGQPTKVLPVTPYLVPGNGLYAQEVNYVCNQAGAYEASLLAEFGQLSALHWGTPIVNTTISDGSGHSPDNLQCASWDDLNGCWLLGGVAASYVPLSSGPAVIVAQDIGDTFASVAPGWSAAGAGAEAIGAGGYLSAILASPVTKGLVVAAAFDPTISGGTMQVYSETGGTFTLRASIGLPTATNAELAYFAAGSVYLAITGGSAHSGIVIESSPDAHTWTTRTVPAGITGYTAPGGATWLPCISALSPSKVLAVWRTTGLTTYAYSSDGLTWTAGTLPINATDTPQAIGWNAADGWLVAVQYSGGGAYFLQSVDGINWSQSGAFAATAWPIADMKCLGTLWVAVTDDLNRTVPSRILYSGDAGATWHLANQGTLTDNLANALGTKWTRPRVHVSKTGFMVVNGKIARRSLETGFGTAVIA